MDESFFKRVRIKTNGKTAHVEVDGKSADDKLVAYEIRQEAGGFASVELTYLVYTNDLEYDAEEARVTQKEVCI